MNLTYPKVQYLCSSIGPSQLATYTDKDGKKKLIFKDKGVELTGGAGSSWGKSTTDVGGKKIVILTQTKNVPAKPINADFGIRVVRKLKTPGYVDNSSIRDEAKYYGGTNPNLTTYDEAKVVAINSHIIDMITADKGMNQDAPISSGSVVNARVAYTVVDTDPSDASGFTITWPDGTTSVFATAVTFTGGNQLGIQLMADATAVYGSKLNELLEVYQIATATYVITSRQPGLKFKLGTAVDTTISSQGLLIDSKYDDIMFDLELEPYEWTTQGYNFVKLSCSAFNSPLNAHVNVDGTTTPVTATTNQATQLAGLNAVTSVFALPDSTLGFTVASALSVTSMKITFPVFNLAGNDPLVATLATITYQGTKSGRYSSLTSDDVQRIFAAADHSGFLREAIRGAQTVAGVSYTRFAITGINVIGGLHGAGHIANSKTTIEIFIPTEATRGNKWCDADKATGVDVPSTITDRTIEEVIAAWIS